MLHPTPSILVKNLDKVIEGGAIRKTNRKGGKVMDPNGKCTVLASKRGWGDTNEWRSSAPKLGQNWAGFAKARLEYLPRQIRCSKEMTTTRLKRVGCQGLLGLGAPAQYP
jgi:hypothetical protein